MHKQIFRFGLSLLLVLCVTLLGGVEPANALTDEQRLVAQVWRIVNRNYLDDTFNHQNWAAVRKKILQKPLNNQESAYGEIQNMLQSLDDPFTRFLNPEQYRSLQVNTSGELTGVGLQIGLNSQTGKLEVVAPIAGSPAEKAGILPRDRITKIEGFLTDNFSLDEAAAKMRGPIGSRVTLRIAREKEPERDVILTRDRIAVNPVIAQLKPGSGGKSIGYIRLTQFNANATGELAHAIDRLEKQGANAYILDLRNNPGGLLQSGVEIARLWLDSGTIVYTVNRQGVQGSFEAFGPAMTDDPLVVLVNQGTASASEILAGALKENQRAQLVGENTFGKGLIQSLFELSDGSGLAVTIAKYETPQHHDIHKLGIKPDKEIAAGTLNRNTLATSEDRQYQAAVEILSKNQVMVGAV